MSIDPILKNNIEQNIHKLMSMDAEYVDSRFLKDDNSESIMLYNGNLESNDTTYESGVGVRVLYKGTWGFAATSDLNSIDNCFEQALSNAKTASTLVKVPLSMGKLASHKSSYASPIDIDPFEVPLKEKLDFLIKLDEKIKEEWILQRVIRADFQKKYSYFFNSEGTEVERKLYNVFASINIMALDNEGQMQSRTHDLFTTGKGGRGWEMLIDPELFSGNIDRIKSELSELTKAPSLEYAKKSVILLPSQAWLQVHETIGHPLELDRILGY